MLRAKASVIFLVLAFPYGFAFGQQECGVPLEGLCDCELVSCSGRLGEKSLIEILDERATSTRKRSKPWSLVEYDFDNRGFNILHFMGSTSLPFGFDLWGFIDLEGDDLAGIPRADLTRFFLELDLRRELWENGGLIAEYNDLQGSGNSVGRFGVFFQPTVTLRSLQDGWLAGQGKLAFKLFPFETDGRGGQVSFNWNKRFDRIGDGRFSAGGFFDLNFKALHSNSRPIIVTEHQIRWRVADGLHLITEFRVNEFLDDEFGIAPGLQYRF